METVVRHYCDLAEIVGDASLLTDVARKFKESRGKAVQPVKPPLAGLGGPSHTVPQLVGGGSPV